MLHRLLAAATALLLLLPTAALADPPENNGETEYQEDVIVALAPADELGADEEDGANPRVDDEFGAGE